MGTWTDAGCLFLPQCMGTGSVWGPGLMQVVCFSLSVWGPGLMQVVCFSLSVWGPGLMQVVCFSLSVWGNKQPASVPVPTH